ncbi:hypothetical protein mRhiFer1_009241 [Rhinolophus ferrumequinum]|uniref:Lipid-binding serum glycoprotein N-terminal domain-containing protein n=1 Tax=Rhinolophus ferrumequinum TaxID=59479 RepID=A0A7J7S7V4_RHIFE|nr:hypothetical protein mRhiFer1_009241 [Rhinolophus ferrumequinum]
MLMDFRDSVENFINMPINELIVDIPLSPKDMVQVKDFQILPVSLKKYPDDTKADLNVPFRFSVVLNLPGFDPLTFHMGMDVKIELYLEKNKDGNYQLNFSHCSFVPESLWIQLESSGLATKLITENRQRKLKILIANKLGAFVSIQTQITSFS